MTAAQPLDRPLGGAGTLRASGPAPPRRAAALLLVMALLVAACTPSGRARVDLAVLVDQQEAWHGRLVEVTGTVQTFDAPRHYWIEDVDQNRVELLPIDGLEEFVGQPVTVRGRFTFREGEGRRITIDDLLPAGVGSTGAVGLGGF